MHGNIHVKVDLMAVDVICDSTTTTRCMYTMLLPLQRLLNLLATICFWHRASFDLELSIAPPL